MTTLLTLELQLLSPTCVAQRPTAPGQPTESLGYLPGTAVRGALASLMLRGRRYDDLEDDEQKRFYDLFITGRSRFGNALPRRDGARRSERTWVVPRTAWTDKQDGGWRNDEEAGPQAGVYDALPAILNGQIDSDEWASRDRLGQEFASAEGGVWHSLPLHRRLITRTALNHTASGAPFEEREVAAEGQLYTIDALDTGQIYHSDVEVSDELAAELQKLVPAGGARVTAGQGRSRGLGQVRATWVTATAQVRQRTPEQLIAQARAFTERSRPLGLSAAAVYIPVTLESDLILRDQFLLPCASGDPRETLWRYIPPTQPFAMDLVEAVQSTRWLSGWDELRRLPRPPQLAVASGSVWVYAVTTQSDLAAAIAWWLHAERIGLGERRGEGFGRVRLLHPFHTEEGPL